MTKLEKKLRNCQIKYIISCVCLFITFGIGLAFILNCRINPNDKTKEIIIFGIILGIICIPIIIYDSKIKELEKLVLYEKKLKIKEESKKNVSKKI